VSSEARDHASEEHTRASRVTSRTELNSLLTASGISGVGDGLRQAAIPLLAASLTRSPSAVAAVAVAQTLPWLLCSMPAGALVDRWDRRRTILTVNVVRGLLMLTLGTLVLFRLASLPLLVLLAFVFAAAEVVSDIVAQALLPAIVARKDLEWANGRLFALQTGTAQFIGPPVGGLIFAASKFVPFLVDGVSFLTAFGLLRRIRALPATETGRGRLAAQMAEGLRFLLHNRVLRAIAFMSAFGNLLLQVFVGVFVLYVLEVLHGNSVLYGVFLAIFAVGVTIGSMLAPRAKQRCGETVVLFSGAALMGVPLGALAVLPSVVVTAAAMLVSGLGMGLWQVISSSLRQAITPDRLLGRVMSSYRLIGRGATSLGAALGGVLASSLGLRAPALACALGMIVVLVLSFAALRPGAVTEAREAALKDA
jgi:MFS family permease